MLIKNRTKTILFLLLFIFVLAMIVQSVTAHTLILRPNGDETVNFEVQVPSGGNHFDKVDEAVADDNTTYVTRNGVTAGVRWELFYIENHTTEIGVINYVSIFTRTKRMGDHGGNVWTAPKVKMGGNVYGIWPNDVLTTDWATYSRTWTVNPASGITWTWANIDDLIAGIKAYNDFGYAPYVDYPALTQVYVVVDYTNSPTNLVADVYNCSILNLTWNKYFDNDTVIIRKNDSCPTTVGDGLEVYNGSSEFYSDTNLFCSQKYCYSAWGWNGTAYSSNYTCVCECTPPCPPWNLSYNTTIHTNGTLNIQINWTKGDCANRTIIIRNADTPPVDPFDGELIYNGTGITYTDLYIGQAYYYTLFSYYNQSPCQKYSSGVLLNWSIILINTFDETNGSDVVNFSVFFSNADGTDTYSQDNCNNPQMVPTDICPTSDNIALQVSADGYDTRFYYLDIHPSGTYTINAYLPPSPETYVYLITVVDPYDLPVENAYVVFKHYDNATGTYVTVSSLWTDANGQVNLELISSEIYKIIVTKTGYTTEIVDYVPSPAIYTFTIKLQIADVPPESIETLFDGINWNIYPDERYHTNNITIYFNITSSDNKLEWFRALVYWYNETTAVWDLLYNKNISVLPGGSSISYTTPNVTGRYAVKCYFKKENFTEYEVTQEGSRLFFIEWGGLGTNPGFIAIPNWIYLLITTLIMMVVMAFLLPYAGLATGYVGIGIFGFALSLKPDLAMAGGLVSGWFILIITAIVYTLVLFLWSRI